MLVENNLRLQAIILPEVLKKAKELSGKEEDRTDWFEKGGRNFLKACEMFFPDAQGILADQHNRCHPGIANFCNEYVYAL